MTITRKLFGIFPIRIKLNDAEIYAAYCECQHDFDMGDIKSKLECRWDEDEIPERLHDDEVISRIADRFRKYMDSNDNISESLWMCADDAIDYELTMEEIE